MNQYTPDNKIFRTSIALALLGAIGMVVALFVVYSRISSIEREVGKTQEMSGSVEQAFKIKGQLNELEAETAILDSFFVSKKEEVLFIESIEGAASSTGVVLEIKNISVDSKSASKSFKEDLLVNIESKGSKVALLAFFKKMESLPKAVWVERFDMRSLADSWSLDVTIRVPRLK